MKSEDVSEWKKEIEAEFERFEKYNVFKPVPRSDLPDGEKVLTTTWAFKHKANGSRRGRLNARGYEQLEGEHFMADSVSSPVTNPATIRILILLLCMNPAWICKVEDVEGAFLQGTFENGEVIYCEVPDGMEEFYGTRASTVLLMQVPLYGTKQASRCFYQKLVEKNLDRGYQRSTADNSLFFIVRNGQLSVFASWVDDIIIMGLPSDVRQIEQDLERSFVCKSEGEMKEYVGSKIDILRDSTGLGTAKFTQPVLVQKLKNDFDLDSDKVPRTPALPGQVLTKGDGNSPLPHDLAKKFRSATATIMYLMQWSRPEVYNATRNCSRVMSNPQQQHWKPLVHLMKYVTGTPGRGLTLAPNRIWNGDMDFFFSHRGPIRLRLCCEHR
jgi:hypothetical protein